MTEDHIRPLWCRIDTALNTLPPLLLTKALFYCIIYLNMSLSISIFLSIYIYSLSLPIYIYMYTHTHIYGSFIQLLMKQSEYFLSLSLDYIIFVLVLLAFLMCTTPSFAIFSQVFVLSKVWCYSDAFDWFSCLNLQHHMSAINTAWFKQLPQRKQQLKIFVWNLEKLSKSNQM